MRKAFAAVLLAAVAIAAAPPPGDADRDLLPQLRENRRRNLEHLRQYARRGEFPKNEDFAEEAVPHFVDRHGTPCAVGYLMLQSGLAETVARIARESNHVRISDLTEGPVFDWILTSGLTQEECARIQPGYRKRMTTLDGVVQIDGSVATLRIQEPWVIPREFLDRPHLPETNRVRSHLMQTQALLEKETLSLDLAMTRLMACSKKNPVRILVPRSVRVGLNDRSWPPPPRKTYRWIQYPSVVYEDDSSGEVDPDPPSDLDPIVFVDR